MEVVITGIAGFRNRGVEAFVVSTIDEIKRRSPDARITVLSRTPEYDAMRCDQPGVAFATDGHRGLRAKMVRPVETFVPGRVKARLAPDYMSVGHRISRASALVVMGGDIFSSTYGDFDSQLVPLRLAQRHGVPSVMLGHSIGPFERSREAEAWMQVARSATAVTIRESLSYRYVIEDLGLRKDLVEFAADPAFLLAPSPLETVDRMLEYYGVNDGRPLIGLSVSQGISGFAGMEPGAHIGAWKALIEMLLRSTDAAVLLIPHVQETWTANDDRILATELARNLDYNPRVRAISGDHSAAEFKGMLARCELVIAERMHAAIGALSSNVPTIAISYSVKADGIMTDLLGADEAREKFLIPISDFTQGESWASIVRCVWDSRREVRAQLEGKIREAKASAAGGYDRLQEIIN